MFRRDFLRICAALAGSLGLPWQRSQAVPEKERWLSWSGSKFDLLAPPELGTGHLRVDLSGSMSQLCELLDSTHGLLRWKYDEYSGESRRVPVPGVRVYLGSRIGGWVPESMARPIPRLRDIGNGAGELHGLVIWLR